MAYIDGFVVPVAPGQKEAYRKMAAEVAPVFRDNGALEIVECFEDDVKDGKVTDFRRAVNAKPGENIVFSWIVWPSKEVRDAASKKIMEDPRMKPSGDMPFDMQRMVVGGFEPILRSGESDIRVEDARQSELA
jgi:uncharacterized protein YbaA (DUF1428 family)